MTGAIFPHQPPAGARASSCNLTDAAATLSLDKMVAKLQTGYGAEWRILTRVENALELYQQLSSADPARDKHDPLETIFQQIYQAFEAYHAEKQSWRSYCPPDVRALGDFLVFAELLLLLAETRSADERQDLMNRLDHQVTTLMSQTPRSPDQDFQLQRFYLHDCKTIYDTIVPFQGCLEGTQTRQNRQHDLSLMDNAINRAMACARAINPPL